MIGVLVVFNERDVIETAIRWLLESGHHVHLFDHGSTDGTGEIIRDRFPEVTVRTIDRKRVPFGAVWFKISKWINRHAEHHKWVTWCAADEILRPPGKGDLTEGDLRRIQKRRQVIRPRVREFWASEDDDPDESDHVKRIRCYRWRDDLMAPRHWRIDLTGRMPYGLHRPDNQWKMGCKISAGRWILDHYPVRSEVQGRRKVRLRPHQPLYKPYAKHPKRSLIKGSGVLPGRNNA